VIYVATVHWRDPKWIVPQHESLTKYLDEPYRVFASLEGIAADYDRYFDSVTREDGLHPDKLNALADRITAVAQPSDLIVFLDGDALAIRPWDAWLGSLLSSHPIAAVRRDENAGDLQPHPCFCVTTVGFWNEISGSWRPAPWVTPSGVEVDDVGGKLLATLSERAIEWRPILRSNSVNVHPVLYGVYGKHVYHHGAGFRPPISRADAASVAVNGNRDYLLFRTMAQHRSVFDLRPRHIPYVARYLRDGLKNRKLDLYMREEGRRSEEIYRQLCTDPLFYRRFEEAVPR
jgi:hypothetical protein